MSSCSRSISNFKWNFVCLRNKSSDWILGKKQVDRFHISCANPAGVFRNVCTFMGGTDRSANCRWNTTPVKSEKRKVWNISRLASSFLTQKFPWRPHLNTKYLSRMESRSETLKRILLGRNFLLISSLTLFTFLFSEAIFNFQIWRIMKKKTLNIFTASLSCGTVHVEVEEKHEANPKGKVGEGML